MESSLANAHVHVLVPELEMLIVTEQVTLSLRYRYPSQWTRHGFGLFRSDVYNRNRDERGSRVIYRSEQN